MKIKVNVGIGTTSPSYKLHVNGTAYAVGAAGALSDVRHKTNINNISFDAIEVVKYLIRPSGLYTNPSHVTAYK